MVHEQRTAVVIFIILISLAWMRMIGSLGWLGVCRSHGELIYLSGGGAVGEGR